MMMRKNGNGMNDMNLNGSTLENSFGQVMNGVLGGGSSSVMMNNKSYERILGETIEAQNLSAGGIMQNPNYIINGGQVVGN
jgi:hypothetical protein